MFSELINTMDARILRGRSLPLKSMPGAARRLIAGGMMLCLLLIARGAFAQTDSRVTYTVEKGSSLWFEGSSTVNNFTCRNRQVHGFGRLDTARYDVNDHTDLPGSHLLNAFFYTSVRCLSCGVGPMDNDMYKALKASTYPEIHYALEAFRVLPGSAATDSSFYVQTRGRLTVAGKTNVIDMRVKVTRFDNNELLIQGSKLLFMHDYGIKPPTALWGLIKANDRLTVHFRLLVAPYVKRTPAPETYEAVAQGVFQPAETNADSLQ